MKIKSMSNMQNVATLSIVFISTTSCLLRAGRKRTSFRTLSSRNVRSTDNPPSASPESSHTLQRTSPVHIKPYTYMCSTAARTLFEGTRASLPGGGRSESDERGCGPTLFATYQPIKEVLWHSKQAEPFQRRCII